MKFSSLFLISNQSIFPMAKSRFLYSCSSFYVNFGLPLIPRVFGITVMVDVAIISRNSVSARHILKIFEFLCKDLG